MLKSPEVRSTDVAIVGAGFAGCATAWALAARGVRALVVEREPELGRHSSGRGAGLGRQLAEDDDTSALAIRGVTLLREHFAAHWRPTGGILGFDDAATCAEYTARAAALDVRYELTDLARIVRAWPQLGGLPVAAALFVPRDGVIENRSLLRAYAEGVDIAYATTVERIEPTGRGVELDTTAGRIAARVVVDAAGAWAGGATGDPPLAVFKRHLYTLEAVAPLDLPYVWHLGASEVYVRPDAAGVLACACDVEPTTACAQLPSPDADARLAARLPGSPIKTRWACQRAFAPDRRMRIGRDPRRPWLVWAAALGGHGATASAAVGERAAAAVLEVLDERR